LGIDRPKDAEGIVFDQLDVINKNITKHENKIPFVVGFLGKVMDNHSKVAFYRRYTPFFELIFKNLRENTNYKTNLVMISNFLKNWHEEASLG
jgi:hypothetical protein